MTLPEKRTKLNDLDVDERAELAWELFTDWSVKNTSMAELARQHGMTRDAVKKLIGEAAAYERSMAGLATREAAVRGYSYVQEKMVEIMDEPEKHPVLVRAQAPQSFIQAQTRKDKILGHESPTMNVNVNARSTLEKLKAAMEDANVSPSDLATIGEEEVVEGEVIDDDDAREGKQGG